MTSELRSCFHNYLYAVTLATLPIVLMGGGGMIMVLAAHNLSTSGGLWRIMHQRK